jgi:acyl carrier protein
MVVSYAVVESDNNEFDNKCISVGLFDKSVDIRIVDPTQTEVSEGLVGEIWINSPSKGLGYYNDPELTREFFQAKIIDNITNPYAEYLRTGDLGYIKNGLLYYSGRIKELITVRGINYYPCDIEHLLSEMEDLIPDCSICISKDEQLIFVSEVRDNISQSNYKIICEKIIDNIFGIYQLPISDVYLIKEQSIPRTTSGKLIRVGMCDLINSNQLNYLYHYKTEINLDIDFVLRFERVVIIQKKLKNIIKNILKITSDDYEIDVKISFRELGLDSIMGTTLISEIHKEFGIEINLKKIYFYLNIHKMSLYIDCLMTKNELIHK